MKGKLSLTAFATLLASTIAPSLQAADGAICIGPNMTVTIAANQSTTNYPQISNATRFTCRSATSYTYQQLSQMGWIADSVGAVVVSTSVNTSTGSSSSTSRYQLFMRKP